MALEAQSPQRRTSSFVRRAAVTSAGGALIVVGVPLLVLPGPGIALIAAGMAVLATEYMWAERWMTSVRSLLKRSRRRRS